MHVRQSQAIIGTSLRGLDRDQCVLRTAVGGLMYGLGGGREGWEACR